MPKSCDTCGEFVRCEECFSRAICADVGTKSDSGCCPMFPRMVFDGRRVVAHTLCCGNGLSPVAVIRIQHQNKIRLRE